MACPDGILISSNPKSLSHELCLQLPDARSALNNRHLLPHSGIRQSEIYHVKYIQTRILHYNIKCCIILQYIVHIFSYIYKANNFTYSYKLQKTRTWF